MPPRTSKPWHDPPIERMPKGFPRCVGCGMKVGGRKQEFLCNMCKQLQSAPSNLEWREFGKCSLPPGAPQEDIHEMRRMFFPGRGTGHSHVKMVREFCSDCPVIEECRDYALKMPELSGIWGGMTEEERRLARRDLVAVSA